MSLQHSDFNEKGALLVGSPAFARRISADRASNVQAESRAVSQETLLTAFFSRPGFVSPAPVDPVRHPADLCQSVRAFAGTEGQLSRLARLMGFTFWGEAVAMVLGYAAAFPGEFDISGLKETAPAGLLKARGAIKRGNVLHAPGVRGIQAPLTPETAAFLARVSQRQRLARVDAASLILHRHVGRVLALVCDLS